MKDCVDRNFFCFIRPNTIAPGKAAHIMLFCVTKTAQASSKEKSSSIFSRQRVGLGNTVWQAIFLMHARERRSTSVRAEAGWKKAGKCSRSVAAN